MMRTGLFVAGTAQQMARANRAQSEGAWASRTAEEVRSQNAAILCDVEKLFMITEAL